MKRYVSFVGAILALASSSWALSSNMPPTFASASATNIPVMGRPAGGHGVELRAGYRLDPSSHYNDGSDVTVQRFRLGTIVRRPIRPGFALVADLDAEYAAYSFNQRDDTIFGKSGFMQDAMALRLGLMVMAPINERWGWQVGGNGSVAGETHADFGEAFNCGGLVGVSRIVGPDFKWTLSLVGFWFEGSPLVIPLPGFDWKIGESYRLATQGPGLSFITALSPTTKLTLLGRWEYRQYRLDDDPPVPGGKYYDQRVPIGLELGRCFFSVLEVTLDGGFYAYQQMMIRDEDDNKVVTVVGTPSMFVGLRMNLQI